MRFLKLAGLITVCFSLVMLIFVSGCGNGATNDVATVSGAPNASNAESDANATSTGLPKPKSAPLSGYQFEAPVRIKAGGEYLSVESPGYACPTMADVDGDGKEDLVVGQFNQGYMQFCKNIAGSNEPPEFAAAQWISSGEDKARVPGVW